MYKIVWTATAIKNFKEIYLYYKKYSVKAAYKIKDNITERLMMLAQVPFGGKKILEPLSLLGYRQFVVKNWKIIYKLDEINKSIIIVDIFDARQSPDKLKVED